MYPYQDANRPVEERVEDLLSRMTPEEKVAQMDMIRGVELATRTHEAHFCAVDPTSDFDWAHVEKALGNRGIGFVHDVYSHAHVLNRLQRYFVEETRLGIPCIFTGEALHGISYPGATSFPMPIALGATFDPEITHKIGHAIGKESRTLGITEILAPNLDLAREPRWGRVEETFGEDTFLSSEMAYAIITGEQNHGRLASDAAVACEPKHYVGHGVPEGGTNCSPLHAGPREIETDYLPVFEAGIVRAGAPNVMAAYHSIDGEPVIASEHYLRKILRERYGMRGYVRADFGAVQRLHNQHHMTANAKDSIALAVENGLDVQGFDFPNEVWQSSLLSLLEEGRLSAPIIDDAVRRILRLKMELGLFEHPYMPEGREDTVLRCPEHRRLSRRAAEEAITLLQNRHQRLPLTKPPRRIALIGPSAAHQRLGSYSSVPYGYEVPSLWQELRSRLPDVDLTYHCGCGITPQDVDVIPASWFPEGIRMTYFPTPDFTEPVGEETVNQINFSWIFAKPHAALPFGGYSVRMEGILRPDPASCCGADAFDGLLMFTGNDSVRVYVDGTLLIDAFGEKRHGASRSAPFRFASGEAHHFVIELLRDEWGYNLSLAMDSRTERMEEAIRAAGESDLAILVCGDDKMTSGEGMDRCDLRLYGRQTELIRRVAATGTPVVLILENGKPMDLHEESTLADAILETWFIGEHGAAAIADVLLGKVSPSGHLPISFPRATGAIPCYYNRLPGGNENYLEGPRAALFPFGHGLSYTEFDYRQLRAEKEADGSVSVQLLVANTGAWDADEVVQLYLRDICSSVVTPDLALKAFRRITLPAGTEKEIRFRLDASAFRLLNRKGEWVVEPGEFEICLGRSSADIRCRTIVAL